MSNLSTFNNASISNNMSVGNNITSNSIQTGNLSCSNISSSGLASLSANNLNISGTINNIITPTNLLSLDTTSSIKTSLNTINATLATKANDSAVVHNTGTETIAGLKSFSSNVACPALSLNGVDLNTRLTTDETTITSLSNRLNIDGNGNVALRTTNTNTGLNVGVNNGSSLYINPAGDTLIKNSGGNNDTVLTVRESTSNKSIYLVPNCTTGAYTSITKAGSMIFSESGSPLTLTQNGVNTTGIVIDSNNLLIGSGNNTSSTTPQNYLFFNNGGIGLNKNNPAFPLDINGNVKCNDIYFTNYTDPILGNNTASLTQRWTALNGTLQNDINISTTNSTNITTLQSQVTALQTQINNLLINGSKAYGRWTGTTVSNPYNVNLSQCMYGNFTLNGVAYSGTRIVLESVNNLKGIIQVTADGTASHFARYEILSDPLNFAVITFNPNGSVGNYPFFFTVI